MQYYFPNHLKNVDNEGKKVAEEEDNDHTEEHDCQSWIKMTAWMTTATTTTTTTTTTAMMMMVMMKDVETYFSFLVS